MFQPLAGVRVIDLTQVLAGPYAAYQLGLMGAEVLKIEAPGVGDWSRDKGHLPELNARAMGLAYLTQNANKKSVALNLKSSEGVEILKRLIAGADVFIENFRPGTIDRLGLSFDVVREINPRIVYCSISAFGQDGEMSRRPAYDHVIQAATGMMMMQGDGDDVRPMKVGFPVIDIATGISAAEAILAAVIRRLRGDNGPITLDVSMIDSALALMSGTAANVISTGQPPGRVGNRGFVGSPGAETFATADGHISVAANTMAQFVALCTLLGRPELASPPYVPAGLAGQAFLANVATEELRNALCEAFASARAADLETKLNAANVPAARVRDLLEFLREIYPKTPGIGVDSEPFAFGPAFRQVGIDRPPLSLG